MRQGNKGTESGEGGREGGGGQGGACRGLRVFLVTCFGTLGTTRNHFFFSDHIIPDIKKSTFNTQDNEDET